jgi:hypothetical protein
MTRVTSSPVSRAQRSASALRASGALQNRDRSGLWRSRISGAPLRKSFALHRIRDTRLLPNPWAFPAHRIADPV